MSSSNVNSIKTSVFSLRQMNLKNASYVHAFDEIIVDADHTIEALHVDDGQNMYAMSDRQVCIVH